MSPLDGLSAILLLDGTLASHADTARDPSSSKTLANITLPTHKNQSFKTSPGSLNAFEAGQKWGCLFKSLQILQDCAPRRWSEFENKTSLKLILEKKLGFHPTQVAPTGMKQQSSSFSQSWSKSSKSPRSQSFDRPIIKSTHKRWGGNAPSRSSRHTKFVWSSQMVTSIVAWSTSTQPWSIQIPSLPYIWCTIFFLHTHVGRAHVSWQVFAASCGSPWPLGVGPFHASPWPVSSNVSLKHFPPWKIFWFFKEWSLFLSFYFLSLPQYHHSTLLPSPAFIERYTRLIGLISLSSPLPYYLSQTWDPTLPYHLSLLIPLRIYLAIGLCSIRCHARKPTCNCIPPGVRKCFSETGQCGKCQFRSGPSWTYDWKCEGPVYSDERHLQDVTLEN